MVPYFGRHIAKMFMRGKLNLFGYKICCMWGNDGYPCHIEIYQLKEPNSLKQQFGTRGIMHTVDIIKYILDAMCHRLYFDNFFPSYIIWWSNSLKGGSEQLRESEKTRQPVQQKLFRAPRICNRETEEHLITAVMGSPTLQSGMIIQLLL